MPPRLNGYPQGVSLRPLVGWPGAITPDGDRRRAAFASTFGETMALLERELRLYDKRDTDYPDTILQIAISENDLRRDGLPRASANPAHPGIILTITPKYKPRLALPCDTFLHWHDNVRAVTLTLEALRKIERYGVAQSDEQYRGWQALPPGASAIALGANGAATAAYPTPEAALQYLADLVHARLHGHRPAGDIIAGIYRSAQTRTHPDRNAGDHVEWEKVEEAGQVLKKYGWLK